MGTKPSEMEKNPVANSGGTLFKAKNKPQRRGRAKPVRGKNLAEEIAKSLIEVCWDDLQEWCEDNEEDRN